MAHTTGRLSWRVLEKKLINEAEEIASLNMGARNQYFSINFLGEFIKSISWIFIAVAGATQLYINRMWERSANYIARTFSCFCYRVKLKWSSRIDMSGDTPPLICIWLNSSYLQVSAPCSAFNSSTGNKAKLSLKAVWRLFSNLRPTQLIAILLRHFWFHAISRTRKAGACTVISRSLPRWVDIVAWPVQRRFAYPAKFQKLAIQRSRRIKK